MQEIAIGLSNRHSTSLAIREIKIKLTWKEHFNFILAEKNTWSTSGVVKKQKFSCKAGGILNQCGQSVKESGPSQAMKQNICNSTLSVQDKEVPTLMHRGVRRMFVSDLSVLSRVEVFSPSHNTQNMYFNQFQILISGIICYLLFCVWLVLLSTRSSKFSHVVAKNNITYILRVDNIPLYEYIIYSLYMQLMIGQ